MSETDSGFRRHCLDLEYCLGQVCRLGLYRRIYAQSRQRAPYNTARKPEKLYGGQYNILGNEIIGSSIPVQLSVSHLLLAQCSSLRKA